ncbi:MAG: hypothetical protein R3E31_06735 [Chloroflexota bacterium]
MSNSTLAALSGAESVQWNLRDLYAAPDDAQLAQDMQAARTMAPPHLPTNIAAKSPN